MRCLSTTAKAIVRGQTPDFDALQSTSLIRSDTTHCHSAVSTQRPQSLTPKVQRASWLDGPRFLINSRTQVCSPSKPPTSSSTMDGPSVRRGDRCGVECFADSRRSAVFREMMSKPVMQVSVLKPPMPIIQPHAIRLCRCRRRIDGTAMARLASRLRIGTRLAHYRNLRLSEWYAQTGATPGAFPNADRDANSKGRTTTGTDSTRHCHSAMADES